MLLAFKFYVNRDGAPHSTATPHTRAFPRDMRAGNLLQPRPRAFKLHLLTHTELPQRNIFTDVHTKEIFRPPF